VEAVEPALDQRAEDHEPALRIAQRLPRPPEHGWIIAGNRKAQLAGAVAVRVVEVVAAEAGAEQRGEHGPAPGVEGGQQAFGTLGVRGERVLEEAFEVPAQLPREAAVGQALDGLRRG
jgi:hypothetical protein